MESKVLRSSSKIQIKSFRNENPARRIQAGSVFITKDDWVRICSKIRIQISADQQTRVHSQTAAQKERKEDLKTKVRELRT